MASKVKIYSIGSTERTRLEVFCMFVNNMTDDFRLVAQDTYFDFGQDWKYTAIIYKDSNTEYQAFCPRDWELILNTDSIEKLNEMATYYADMQTSGEWNYKKSLYSKFE